MTKAEFLALLGDAYHFPAYYSQNLDSADEILGDMRAESGQEALSLRPLLEALLAEASTEERAAVLALLAENFRV